MTGVNDETTAPSPVGEAIRRLLLDIGEDPAREGLRRTPERIERMYRELTAGYHVDPDTLFNDASFEVEYDEMVVVRDIDFYSLCEHHLLPFYGRAHVGYLPRGRVIGLSKIPRVVDMYARRLQVQERMTQQIAGFLMDRLDPKGVGCVVEAAHLCTMMRGVQKTETRMLTSAMLGRFRQDPKTRSEFLALIGRPTQAPDR
jgi:GTP cyclohydrolase IA